MSALLRKRPSKVDQGSVCLSCLAKSFSSPHQYYANLYHKYCPFLSNPIRKAYLKESNGRRNFATVAVERREEEGTDEQFQPNLPKTAGRERNGKRTDSLEFRNFEVIKTSKSSTVSNTKSSKSKKPRKERHRQASKGFKKRLDRSSQKVELRIKVIERISHELNKISFSVRSEQPPKLLNSGSDRVDTTSTRVRMIRKRLITRTKVIERIARQLDLITSSARPTQTQKVLDSDPDKIHETSKQPHNVLEKTKSLSKNSREVPSGKKSRPPPKNDGSASTAQEGLGENRRSELIQRLESDIRALKKGLDAKAKAGRGPRILKVLTPKVESLKASSDIEGFTLEEVLGKPKAKKKNKSQIYSIDAEESNPTPIEVHQPPVPSLAYGLERVLFNPGVYHLQDPRSRVYNFDPYLQRIMPVSEFNFDALKEYITSSRDESLSKLAKGHGKRYVGSSSSMTGALAHFHFLLSQWRGVNTTMLSREFPDNKDSFTRLQRCPSAVFLKWKNGTYAIDADKEFATANVLMMLGKSLEKFLTLETGQFERYRKSNPDMPEEDRNEPESYHYSAQGGVLMRAQLDAHDSRLPGTGMFDLKTRAVVSIRMDAMNYQEGSGYQIRQQHGEWESFEREYFDMIRSAFLKYSLQVRIGRMDGIFVAFHNTERLFGFQYISRSEMDLALHGQYNTALGDMEFGLSVGLLDKILDRATQKFPEKSLRIHFETRDAQTPFMYIFAEPVSDEQIQELQSKNDAKIAEFEREMMSLDKQESEKEDQNSESQWAAIQASVQQAMDNDDDYVDETGEQDGRETATGTDPELPRTPSGNEELEEKQHMDWADKGRLGHEDKADNKSNVEPAYLEGERDSDTQEMPLEGTVGEASDLPSESSNTRESSSTLIAENAEAHSDDVENQADSSFLNSIAIERAQAVPNDQHGLLAMTLTIRNKINNNYVVRPQNLVAEDKWKVEYSLDEVPKIERAWSLYAACQLRRKKQLEDERDSEQAATASYYMRNLKILSSRGKAWREKQDRIESLSPKVVLGQSSA